MLHCHVDIILYIVEALRNSEITNLTVTDNIFPVLFPTGFAKLKLKCWSIKEINGVM